MDDLDSTIVARVRADIERADKAAARALELKRQELLRDLGLTPVLAHSEEE